MARKAAFSEKLTDSNIEKVIGLLRAEKPITKKSACEILGITYNTTRLDSIIETFLKKKEFDAEQRAKKKFTAATPAEIDLIISSYLIDGDPISSISKRIYRSDSFVSNVLERVNCPRREVGGSYFHPPIIPDIAVKQDFKKDEKVFSARYNSLATIVSILPSKDGPVYSIWLEDEKWQQYAYQPWWELASLEHLKPYCTSIK